MTPSKHLRILRDGVDAWNQWRRENHHVAPSLRGAILRDVDLTGANLLDANLTGAHLEGANLSTTNLSRATLRRAKLMGANLSRTTLFDADISRADLTGANLYAANLCYANLSLANFSDASLKRALLSFADLSHTTLNGTDMTSATIGWTIFADADLSAIQGLEKIRHSGPSTIGIDALHKSKGQIPELFLHKCGVPIELIEYVRWLSVEAFEQPSCFLCHAPGDRHIAERIQAELQARGVNSWFNVDDPKAVDRSSQRIDDTIRMFDKVVVMLSQNSLLDQRVQREVEVVLEREERQGISVLVPIRIDKIALAADNAWSPSLSARSSLDFSCWNDHAALQQAVETLIAAL